MQTKLGYSTEGQLVVLRMPRRDYLALMAVVLEAGVRASGESDTPRMWELVDLMNRINAGNPTYPHQEMPEAVQ
jgi:hypothetical protein